MTHQLGLLVESDPAMPVEATVNDHGVLTDSEHLTTKGAQKEAGMPLAEIHLSYYQGHWYWSWGVWTRDQGCGSRPNLNFNRGRCSGSRSLAIAGACYEIELLLAKDIDEQRPTTANAIRRWMTSLE